MRRLKLDIGKNEIAGDHNMLYIEIVHNKVPKRFDFEIDSNYMANELKKTIETWK